MLVKRTTHAECLAAFKWAEEFFDYHPLSWGVLPGTHDDEEGIITFFSMKDVIDQLGYVRALEVISYRASVKGDAESRALLMALVMEAAEIRKSYGAFGADFEIYKAITSGFKDIEKLKEIQLTLELFGKYVHFPLVFSSFTMENVLLRILIDKSYASRLTSFQGEEEVIRDILSDYEHTNPMTTKFADIFKTGYCESGSHVEDVITDED